MPRIIPDPYEDQPLPYARQQLLLHPEDAENFIEDIQTGLNNEEIDEDEANLAVGMLFDLD